MQREQPARHSISNIWLVIASAASHGRAADKVVAHRENVCNGQVA
jgi:hypothetical protein